MSSHWREEETGSGERVLGVRRKTPPKGSGGAQGATSWIRPGQSSLQGPRRWAPRPCRAEARNPLPPPARARPPACDTSGLPASDERQGGSGRHSPAPPRAPTRLVLTPPTPVLPREPYLSPPTGPHGRFLPRSAMADAHLRPRPANQTHLLQAAQSERRWRAGAWPRPEAAGERGRGGSRAGRACAVVGAAGGGSVSGCAACAVLGPRATRAARRLRWSATLKSQLGVTQGDPEPQNWSVIQSWKGPWRSFNPILKRFVPLLSLLIETLCMYVCI